MLCGLHSNFLAAVPQVATMPKWNKGWEAPSLASGPHFAQPWCRYFIQPAPIYETFILFLQITLSNTFILLWILIKRPVLWNIKRYRHISHQTVCPLITITPFALTTGIWLDSSKYALIVLAYKYTKCIYVIKWHYVVSEKKFKLYILIFTVLMRQ